MSNQQNQQNQQNQHGPNTVSAIYPERWLKAVHLKGKQIEVTIARAYPFQIWTRQAMGKEWRIVLDFGRKLDLILTPTNAHKLKQFADDREDYAEAWPGITVRLSPGKTAAGKDTIIMEPIKPAPEGGQNG